MLTASFIGNFVEWFDYASYGYFATVIAVVFFPEIAPAAGLLATFAVFAISFVIRPVGGIVWGRSATGSAGARPVVVDHYHVGGNDVDRGATVLCAGGTVGAGAAVAGAHGAGLFRFRRICRGRLVHRRICADLQARLLHQHGAGEHGGRPAGVADVGRPLRHAQRRGHAVLWLAAAFPAGRAAGTDRPLHPPAAGGHAEVPPAGKAHHVEATPTRELFTSYRRQIAIAFGATCLNAVGFYLILSHMPTYLITEMGMGQSESFIATSIALAAYIFFIFLMGMLSDRFGRKTALIAASVLFMVLTVPLFTMLDGASFWTIVLIQIAFGALLTVNDGTLPCFLSEIFPTRVRYSGFAFSFNAANALFGGTARSWRRLIATTGSKLAPAVSGRGGSGGAGGHGGRHRNRRQAAEGLSKPGGA